MTTAAAPSVLVVDDEPDMRGLARIFLEMDGFEVVGEAVDGEQAVALYIDSEPPSVVLLDNRMPVMSGMEAAERILAHRPEQLVVLFSAYLDDEAKARARDIGVATCVDKTDVSDLPRLLRSLLER